MASELFCSSHNWNTLFLGANTVADVMAEKYGKSKSQILDTVNFLFDSKQFAVRMVYLQPVITQYSFPFKLTYKLYSQAAKESLGVRMALGETQIVAETREFLMQNGVALDSFSQVF